MEPLNVYLAEELAAAYVQMDATEVVVSDTVARMRMCIAEVNRLNQLLNDMEEQLQLCRNALTEEMARNTRLELEAHTMKSMITTMKTSLDRYRRFARNKMGCPREMPESLSPYYERRRIRMDEEIRVVRRRLGIENSPDSTPDSEETEPEIEEINLV